MSAEALIAEFEQRKSRALGNALRRKAGLYYTPPELAAQVVALALRYGGGSVLDPCAGAGAFLLAARRAGVRDLRGMDLDAAALRVARRVAPGAWLKRADALLFTPAPADLVVSNPPYGHVAGARERARLLRQFPALRGGEIDRYAAFLLRAVELVRPGGVAALLVPDTWMFLARAGPLREAVLERAEIAAIVDLGKPFASAKDTRVQAVVLQRRPARRRAAFVGRGAEALAPVGREELLAGARRGWFVYRTAAERALCAAMEARAVPLGAACAVGYGMRTGANARHVARRAPAESELGLIGGEDIVPYALRWRPKALVDGASLRPLVERQVGVPRVAVQRIRTNSQAPWARWLEAAPVPAERVCLDSLSTLAAPADLLWALLALVQSVAMQRYHRLRTTDVNVKPSALRELPVPRALVDAPAASVQLAAMARERAAVEGMSDPRGILITGGALGAPLLEDRRAHLLDRRIDAAVYALFRLDRKAVEAAERGFWADRFPEEIQLLDQSMSDPPASVARMLIASHGPAGRQAREETA